jgi:serine O-acetyltransferase
MEINMLQVFRRDAQRHLGLEGRPPWTLVTRKTLVDAGLQFVLLLRLQDSLQRRGRFGFARLISLINLQLTGGDAVPGCTVGPGLVARHPLGVVIGRGTEIGEDATILGKVTFGEKDVKHTSAGSARRAYPRVGDRCVVGTNATLLGDISVGDDVTVGAHTLVLTSVPDGSTVVGIPGRVKSP